MIRESRTDDSLDIGDSLDVDNPPVSRLPRLTEVSPTAGLHYNHERWYDSRTGRFLSFDPIDADSNPYRYAGNSPTNATDPSGEAPSVSAGGAANDYEAARQAAIAQRGEMLAGMRGLVQKLAAGLPADKQKQASSELERLIKAARDVPAQSGRNQCVKYVDELRKNYGNSKTPLFRIDMTTWDYPIGVPWTDWWLGHAALQVTFSDGSIYYFDNGWWNHCFTPSQIPPWVKQFTP